MPLLDGHNLEALPLLSGFNLEALPLLDGHNLEELPVLDGHNLETASFGWLQSGSIATFRRTTSMSIFFKFKIVGEKVKTHFVKTFHPWVRGAKALIY